MQFFKWLGIEIVEVSFREKLIAAIGSGLAIYLVFLLTRFALSRDESMTVVASMGATAVLLFAVPHGQLSQPWAVLGGHVISALIGVCCAQMISDRPLAAAIAVGSSIGIMHQLKCLHPPGGATAFTAVMGGDAVQELGFLYVLFPVAANATLMLLLAVAINYPFHWRRYPALWIRRTQLEPTELVVSNEEQHRRFIEALRTLDSFVDVSEEDLVYLANRMTNQIANRPSKSS